MADLLLYGNTQANVNAQPITAGQLLYTTDLTHNKQYLDKDGSTRVEIGGMDLITSEVDFNAQTASTDKALDSFVLKEILDGMTVINDGESNPIATTNLIDTLTGIVSNTTANQVAGALAVKTLEARFTYSTTEAVVGTWIDGRPIYQKTINFGTLPNATIKTVAHGISNVDIFTEIRGTSYNPTSGVRTTLPRSHPTVAGADVDITCSSTNVSVQTGTDYSGYTTCYIFLQYIKTT